MRTHKPFLCLAFKTIPEAERRSNFKPRAEPCCYLCYVRERKAYALLTIPNLYLTFSIEVRFVSQAFPLRVTDYLSNQLDTFLRPTVEDQLYASVHGPANVLRRSTPSGGVSDDSALVRTNPITAREPVDRTTLPGPGHSSTRGYIPSADGLTSAAYMQAISDCKELQAFTADQLTARTPSTTHQALNGPDAKYWKPAIVRDFDILREQQCFSNVTSNRPDGPRHLQSGSVLKSSTGGRNQSH